MALSGALALLASCGVPTGSPQELPKDHVPFGLMSPSPPSPTTTVPAADIVPITVFLVAPASSASVVPVSRQVSYPALLDTVLTTLLEGPLASESKAGFSTAIPAGTRLISASVAGTIATVNFSAAFGQVTGPQQAPAVEQVLFTVTTLLGINTGVDFDVNGQPIDVPTPSGAQVPGPVYALQFLPPPATTTPASPP